MTETDPVGMKETVNGLIDLVLYGGVMHFYGWKGLALSALVESGYQVTMWRRQYFDKEEGDNG